jgi:acetyl esterase/lipase
MPETEPWSREWGRILSLIALSMNGLILLHPRGGRLAPVMWIPKLLAGAWAPVMAAVGLTGAALSTRHLGDGWRVLLPWLAGLVGAGIGVWHTARIAAPHESFAETLGENWAARVPASLRPRMQQRRYRLIPPPPPRVPWEEDVAFGTGAATGAPLYANIWLPPDGVPHTGVALLYIFGGAWHFLDKDTGTRHFFRHLAAQGHVVMDTTYTLAPTADLVQMMQDVKQAIAWMKNVGARRYGVDPDRLVLCGCSSGAQMALLAAYTPNHPAFQGELTTDTSVGGVVAYCGIPDLRQSYAYFRKNLGNIFNEAIPLARWGKATFEWAAHLTGALPRENSYIDAGDWIPSIMGGTPESVPGAYDLGSPIHHVGAHCPPTLLFQGAHDFTGIRPDVRRLHQHLVGAGVPAVYVELPGTEHAFDIIPLNVLRTSPAAQAATYDLDRFLGLLSTGAIGD